MGFLAMPKWPPRGRRWVAGTQDGASVVPPWWMGWLGWRPWRLPCSFLPFSHLVPIHPGSALWPRNGTAGGTRRQLEHLAGKGGKRAGRLKLHPPASIHAVGPSDTHHAAWLTAGRSTPSAPTTGLFCLSKLSPCKNWLGARRPPILPYFHGLPACSLPGKNFSWGPSRPHDRLFLSLSLFSVAPCCGSKDKYAAIFLPYLKTCTPVRELSDPAVHAFSK